MEIPLPTPLLVVHILLNKSAFTANSMLILSHQNRSPPKVGRIFAKTGSPDQIWQPQSVHRDRFWQPELIPQSNGLSDVQQSISNHFFHCTSNRMHVSTYFYATVSPSCIPNRLTWMPMDQEDLHDDECQNLSYYHFFF